MPRVVACAVVGDDPPQVFVAEDLGTLNWVLALRLIATVPGSRLEPGTREKLRRAVLDRRWGDAVTAFIAWSGLPVDVYPSVDLAEAGDVATASLELHEQPLFGD